MGGLARARRLLAATPATEDDARGDADDTGGRRPEQRVQHVTSGGDHVQDGAGTDVLRVVVAGDGGAAVADALLEVGDLASVEG